ncbi:MAG: EamA family transporter [Actinomycetales bacterium]|nr:EamA family transporter [Actinomycetales bacterium]
MITRLPALPLVAVGVSVILWSTAYGLSGLVLESASPAVLSIGRFVIALVALVPLAIRRGDLRRVLIDPRTILLGLTGVTGYYSLTNLGLLATTPGTAAIVAALLPVLTAVLAWAMLRERVSGRTVIGLVLATAGVAVAAASGLTIDAGFVLCVVAVASYAVYTVLLRRDAERPGAPDALTLATGTAIWGTVLMLPWLAVEGVLGAAHLPTGVGGWGALAFLGVVVTAPTMVLFNYGAERLPATVSGVLTAGIPALGYAMALLLGEAFDLVRALGGAIALVGIVVATSSSPRIEPSPPGSALPAPADTAPIETIRDLPIEPAADPAGEPE